MGYPSSISPLYSLSSLPPSGPSDRRTQAATDCTQQQPLLETGGITAQLYGVVLTPQDGVEGTV